MRRGRARGEAGLVVARDQQPEASSRACGSGSQQRLEQVQPDVNAAAHFAANDRSLSLCSSCASVHRYEELDKAASQGATARAARVASLQKLISDSDQRSAQSANHLAWLSTHLKSQKEGFGARSAAATQNRTKRKRANEAETEAGAEANADAGAGAEPEGGDA